jgi:hypothetical protein
MNRARPVWMILRYHAYLSSSRATSFWHLLHGQFRAGGSRRPPSGCRTWSRISDHHWNFVWTSLAVTKFPTRCAISRSQVPRLASSNGTPPGCAASQATKSRMVVRYVAIVLGSHVPRGHLSFLLTFATNDSLTRIGGQPWPFLCFLQRSGAWGWEKLDWEVLAVVC